MVGSSEKKQKTIIIYNVSSSLVVCYQKVVHFLKINKFYQCTVDINIDQQQEKSTVGQKNIRTKLCHNTNSGYKLNRIVINSCHVSLWKCRHRSPVIWYCRTEYDTCLATSRN